jgi:hypothetical protein
MPSTDRFHGHFLELRRPRTHPLDPFLGLAAIGFELGFAFATNGAESTALPRKVGPEPRQSWEQILELGEFDLELALPGPGALGEDLKDERRTIQYLAAKNLLQVARLGTREFIVEDDGIHAEFLASGGKLGRLAGTDPGARVWCFQFLGSVAEDHSAHGGGQFPEFIEGIADIPGGSTLEFETYEKGFLRTVAGGFNKGFQMMEWTWATYRVTTSGQGVRETLEKMRRELSELPDDLVAEASGPTTDRTR